MSLVGTRPPTLDEWEKYEPHHRARMSFRPGLTGLWQVSGRSNITDFEEVVRFSYVEIAPEAAIAGAKEMKESVASNGKRESFFKDANRMSGEELFNKYFPETFKVKVEHCIRLTCYKLGIYRVCISGGFGCDRYETAISDCAYGSRY